MQGNLQGVRFQLEYISNAKLFFFLNGKDLASQNGQKQENIIFF